MARDARDERTTGDLWRLEAAWRRLRAGEAGLAPDALARTLLLARDGARTFRVVAGGAEARRLTGLAFGADATRAFAPASRAHAARLLARAATGARPLRARLPLADAPREDPSPPRLQLLLLPLRNAQTGEPCLIAGVAPAGAAPEAASPPAEPQW